jgi:ferredoxin
LYYEITAACVGCTMCAKRCPANAIHGERRSQHFIDPSLCAGCGACWRQCPKASIIDALGRRRRGKPAKELPRAEIAVAECAGCQTCLLTCPFDAIAFVRKRFPLVGIGAPGHCVVDPARCVGCSACVEVCPTGACRIEEEALVLPAKAADE